MLKLVVSCKVHRLDVEMAIEPSDFVDSFEYVETREGLDDAADSIWKITRRETSVQTGVSLPGAAYSPYASESLSSRAAVVG